MKFAAIHCSVGIFALLVACGDDGGRDTTTGPTTPTAPTATTGDTTGTGDLPTTGTPADTTDTTGPDLTTSDPPVTTTTPTPTTGPGDTTADTGDPTTDTGGIDCVPPDALIVLDRTQSMHRTPDGQTPVDGPGYASSKWATAIAAIEQLSQPPLDDTVRFGLELWPRDPADGTCVTLADRIENNAMATNPMCETGEVVLPPAVGNGPAIADAVDPATTLLCNTTPTGSALITAGEYLATIAEPGREQYAILVTDGADWEFSCPDPSPLGAVQDLAEQGVKTFVVGFSGEEAAMGATAYLNDLACAGQTAKGFPGPCSATADGFLAVDPTSTVPIYLQADDGDDLDAALAAIGSEVCCGCVKACDPPDVLFALDRTLSMHRTPDGATPVDAPAYASSKWSQALTAVEDVVTGGLDGSLRFGLELWPLDPGGGQCLTLEERILDSKQWSNPMCQAGEIVIPPTLNSGDTIAGAIDPLTTHICNSTPTGLALDTAGDWMAANAVPGRRQIVVLVTDGADWDLSCPDPSPLLSTQQLAAAGVQTYVVGFFGAEAQAGALAFLNDMACAGQTAANFADNCVQMGAGYVAADPNGQTPLYLQAGDGELTATLGAVADEILASCVPG
jgi:Mg-chelatase subunit ChlD